MNTTDYKILYYNDTYALVEVFYKGRCVYANREITKGEVLSIDPLLYIEDNVVAECNLKHYCWGGPQHIYKHKSMLPLGLIPIYAHSRTPNLELTFDFETNIARATTVRSIHRGEEITVTYGREFETFEYIDEDDLPKEQLQQIEIISPKIVKPSRVIKP